MFLPHLAAYCDARRAAGWKVVVATQIGEYLTSDSTNYPKFVTWRTTYDPTVRTWVGTHCDAVCDFAADATMGPFTAANDNQGTLYLDVVHPSVNGQNLLAPIMGAVIAGLG